MKSVLLSGGVDSALLSIWQQPKFAVFIDYGQSCRRAEYISSRGIADRLGMEFLSVEVDCRALGAGSLAGSSKAQVDSEVEWWPYRNQLLVTLAAMTLFGRGATELMLGTVKSDSIFRDGQQEFVGKIDALLRYQEGGLAVSTPAISLSTSELFRIVRPSTELLASTHSCHVSDVACGQCRGCVKRSSLFQELGIEMDID